MYKKNIWILIVVAIAVVAGLFLLLGSKSINPTSTNVKPNVTGKYSVPVSEVSVTQSGFEPQTITIKPGVTVVWSNKSGGDVTVNSDNHPTHLLWPFLNLGKFANGSKVSVVFKTAGTYTYHNHLNPSQKGTVIVK